MAGSLGTISGQIRLDAAQAIAAFAAVRAASAETSGSLDAAGGSLKKVGTITMGAGLAMLAGFGVAVKAAADFDTKMSYVQAVTHDSGAEMDLVRNKAMELGKTGQFSAGEIADGFVDLAKAGVTTQQMIGGMADAMVNLASAAVVPLSTSVDDLVAIIHTYGLSNTDAAHVSDVLTGAMHSSVLSLDDITNTMKYAGSVAHSLGISLDSTATATALLGKAGIVGSSAGTQLRQIMLDLGGATKPATAELKSLGIITKSGSNEFFTSAGKAKDLATVFQILQDHTKNLTSEQELMAFKTIFNSRAIAATEILTKAGASGFDTMAKSIQRTTAASVAAEKLNNLNGDIQKLKGSIDTMLIGAGQPMQKYMRDIVQTLTKVINTFISMPAGVQEAVIAFLGIAGAALTLIGAIVLIGGTVIKFIGIVRQTIAAFRLFVSMLNFVKVAMSETMVAFLTNPIVLVVIAVVALAIAFYELYNHCKTFRDIINDIGRTIASGFMDAIRWFGTLPKFFEDIWTDISGWFEQGVGWVKKNWDILLAIFTGPIGLIILIINRFGGTILNFFKEIPAEAVNFLSTAWSSFTSFMTALPDRIAYAIGFIIGYIIRLHVEAAEELAKLAVDAWNAIESFFEKLPGELETWLTEAYNNIVKWGKESGDNIASFAETAFNDVVKWFEQLPGRIASFFESMYNKGKEELDKFASETKSFAIDVFNDIVNFFERLPGETVKFFEAMYNDAKSAFNSFINGAKSFGSTVYNDITGFLSKLPGTISNIVGECITAFKQAAGQAFDAVKGFASSMWNGFKKGLGINSPSLIEKQMTQITSVCQTETAKLKTHVQVLQGLSAQITKADPSKAASTVTTNTIKALTTGMTQQAALLKQAAIKSGLMTSSGSAMAAAGLPASAASAMPGTGLTSSTNQSGITFNVYNPVAEKSSDTAARKLRTLTSLGAF